MPNYPKSQKGKPRQTVKQWERAYDKQLRRIQRRREARAKEGPHA